VASAATSMPQNNFARMSRFTRMIHCVARWDWTTATGHGIVKPSSGWLPDFGLPITGSCRYQRQDPAYPFRRDSLTPEMIQERCLIDDAPAARMISRIFSTPADVQKTTLSDDR
jgi:hypothetical protein